MAEEAAIYGAKRTPRSVGRAIADLAERQHGPVALRQLVELGLSPRAVRSRVERGRLFRVHRGVFALSPLLTEKGRLMAGVLACGPDAALSHRSAAHLLGIRRSSRPRIEVSVPRGGGRSRAGIQVHEMRSIDATVIDGIRCTTLAQTLLDLCEVIRPFEVRKAITESERLRIFDLRDVECVLAGARGRRGAPVLESLLAEFEPVLVETKIEELFLPLCPKRPRVQQWVDGYRPDFHWPVERVIAETDGWETHGTRTAFEKDRERLQDLVAAGWRVVSFTYRQITREPERVRRILDALLTPSPAGVAAA